MRIALVSMVLAAVVCGQDEKKTKTTKTEKLTPKTAWMKLVADSRAARNSRDAAKRKEVQAYPKKFIEQWEKSGAEAKGEDLLFLGHFYANAEQHAKAMKTYLAATTAEGVADLVRDRAKQGYVRALSGAIRADTIAGDAAAAALKKVVAFRDTVSSKSMKAQVDQTLGGCHEGLGQYDAAIACWMASARGNPAGAYNAARSVVGALMHHALDLDKVAAVRGRAAKAVAELKVLQAKHVEAMKSGGADPRGVQRAEWMLGRMDALIRPLDMIGKPVADWTLEHAYADVKSLADVKGKVVVMDFWATWCPWCIKSFPAIRDLLKDYKDKPFSVIGVTATSGFVWASRYELDDDFKEKAPSQGRTQPTLRLSRNADEAAKKEHRAKEKGVVKEFIANHEMNWPVVMIDREEPTKKYALAGWPHAVVIDKQGRIRYFKSGALLRDRKKQVADFRKILDKLLAETPSAG